MTDLEATFSTASTVRTQHVLDAWSTLLIVARRKTEVHGTRELQPDGALPDSPTD